MLAAYCDGCMKEIISAEREVMVDWVSEHYDHYRTWTMTTDPVEITDHALQKKIYFEQ